MLMALAEVWLRLAVHRAVPGQMGESTGRGQFPSIFKSCLLKVP